MSETTEELLVGGGTDYSVLGLSSNPYAFAEVIQGGDDPVDAYLASAAAAELERIWQENIIPGAGRPVLWVAPARGETIRADILMTAALVRRLSIDPSSGVMPVYINAQLTYKDFMMAVSNALGDRLAPREFRKCFFALARDAFERVAAGEMASPELEGLDVRPYRDALAESRMREFSQALFPPVPSAKSAEALQKELDELGPEEAARVLAERQAAEEEWERAKGVRRRLRAFFDRVVDEHALGPAVAPAAHEGIRKGFSATAPFMLTSDPGEPHRDKLIGMVKLARFAHRRVVFFLDQLDSLVEFTEPEKQALVGGVAETAAVSLGDVVWLMRGPREIYESLTLKDTGLVELRETAALVPEEVRVEGTASVDQVGELARRFPAYQGKDPADLFEEGVVQAAAERGGDALAAMRALGLAVRAAAERGDTVVRLGDLPS